MSSSIGFMALPAELRESITSQLSVRDTLRLSATCKALRMHLAPRAFTKMRFENNEASAGSVLEVVKKYGHLTTALEFVAPAVIEPDIGYMSDSTPFVLPAVCGAAAELLRGERTPNLYTMRLRFDFDFPEGLILYEDLNLDEDAEELADAERTEMWRAILGEAWTAVSRNQTVTTLIVDGFFPIKVSAYETPECARFLSRLEAVTIKLDAKDRIMSWCTYEDFQWAVPRRTAQLLGHMSSLQVLALEAGADPLGLHGHCHTPLPFPDVTLPALRRLKLRNCFVGPEVVDLVQRHEKLAHLDLAGCSAAEYADDALSWTEFMDQIRDLAPPLSYFDAGDDSSSLIQQHWFGEGERAVSDEVAAALGKEQRSRHFVYAYLDDKYGFKGIGGDTNEEAFRSGEDWNAFVKLQTMVVTNAQKGVNLFTAPADYKLLHLSGAESEEQVDVQESDDEDII